MAENREIRHNRAFCMSVWRHTQRYSHFEMSLFCQNVNKATQLKFIISMTGRYEGTSIDNFSDVKNAEW